MKNNNSKKTTINRISILSGFSNSCLKVKPFEFKFNWVVLFTMIFFVSQFFNDLHAQTTTTFTYSATAQTWVCPQGVTSIDIEAWGSGAGGGASTSSNNANAGGGGGGAYAKRSSVTVVPGTVYTITVGAGGTSNNNGNLSTATFGGVTVTAAGGSRGNSSATTNGIGGIGGLISASEGDVIFSGGDGANGTYLGGNAGNGGGGGSGAGSTGDGNDGNGTNGGGVKLNFGGAGGNGGTSANGTAASATAINYGGGGGGGGHRNRTGGTGRTGGIVITFNCPTPNAGLNQLVCTTTATLAGSTPPVGLTGAWTRTSGSGTVTNANSPTSGITGLAIGSNTFRWTYNNGRCGNTFDEVTITRGTIPSAPVTPSPTNGATAVCYSGSGAITTISWTATAGAVSYDVYFGIGSVPVTLTANVTTNSFNVGTLLANTIYKWKIVAKGLCGDGPASAEWTFTTKPIPCYCIPTASNGVHGTGITNVSYSSVNNTTSNTNVYNDYTSFAGNVIQGAAVPISVTTATGNRRYNIKIWVDWNNNGNFSNAGEEMFSGIVNSNTINGTINVALTAILGNHTMRVGITENRNGAGNEIPTPCFTGNRGAFEDYTINVTPAPVCTIAPTITTNPSNSSLANGGNTSFTAVFGNMPTNYIWEVSNDGGTNFTTITNGGVYSGATTATLTLTAVTTSMNNFKYRVRASNACGTSPISTIVTLTVTITYCSVGSSSGSSFISGISSEGNLNDTSNTSGYSAGGYGNYSNIVIATQIPGGGLNINATLTGASGQFLRVYVDWNGDGLFADPAEQVYSSGTTALLSTSFGFVVPTTQAQGNFRMRIRTRSFTDASTIAPCAATYPTGETEDYTITIVPDCAARIESVTDGAVCGANNSITISAQGLGGTTQYRWYTTETGGILEAVTSTGSYSPTLSATRTYYVTAFNGSCESLVRTKVIAKIIPTTSINFTPASPTTCGEDTVITISAASDIVEEDLFVEDFDGATIDLTASIAGFGGVDSAWSVKTNTYQPTTTAVWRPAISSGSIGTDFGFTTSDYNGANIITRYTTSSTFNTTNFINLSLSFNAYFSHYGYSGENFKVQISENGTAWTDLITYTTDLGSASKFKTELLVIPTTYLNKPTISLRFQYTSGGWSDGMAIDDIRFFGTKQLNTSFTWSSATPVSGYTDISCTPSFLYTNQIVSTIYLKPDLLQLESANFPITVTATLANGCPISQIINVENNTRVWQGGTAWESPANWKPTGVPTSDNCVIIPGNTIIPGSSYQAFAKNLTIKPTGNLNITTGSNLTVTDYVKVNAPGLFNIENNGSLVQINNVANTGNITYKRTANNIKGTDYVYWSSPVSNQPLNTFYTTPAQGPKYIWDTLFNNGNGALGNISQGNWVGASGNMATAKGYIVRGSSNAAMVASTIESTFTGIPNNGDISIPVFRGGYTGPNYSGANGATITNLSDNYNLIGNPYPSSINALQFLYDNSNVIRGSVNLWTHGTDPMSGLNNPFYGSYTYNYSTSDYVTINFTGPTIPGSAEIIKSGQAFFVQMIDGVTGSGIVNFKNNLRRNTSNLPYSNNNFFRTSENNNTSEIGELERHRIWLDIIDSNNLSEKALIGYITGATLEADNFYDAYTVPKGNIDIYSLIGEETYGIQGRPLPFTDIDIVPIGFKVANSGIFNIAINTVDGLFSTTNQGIYLEDTALGIIHDLRASPYSFTSIPGIFNNRFILRFNNTTLGIDSANTNQTFAFISNDKLQIQSEESIRKITIYDIAGKMIKDIQPSEFKNSFTTDFNYANGVYIVKIFLNNESIIGRKLIH